MKKFLLLIYIILSASKMYGLTVSHLRIDAIKNPIGIDTPPHFCWQISSDERGCLQDSYRIVIGKDSPNNVVFDTGFIESSESVNVSLNGFTFSPSTRYFWQVSVTDNYGNVATSSEQAYFETGLMKSGWSGAQWISCSTDNGSMPRFRKKIYIKTSIKEAYLYTSALGLYDLFINGQRVGHISPNNTIVYDELKPGWTDYNKRIAYSTHEVSGYLIDGENVLGALVTNGWWKGKISEGTYGYKPLAFMCKLLVTYTDGSHDVYVTDTSWESNSSGPWVLGDIWDGENYDATLEDNWALSNDLEKSGKWMPSEVSNDFTGELVSIPGAEVRQLSNLTQPVKTVNIIEGSRDNASDFGMANVVSTQSLPSFTLKKGQTAIIDFGQNIVGWTPFIVKGKRGCQLRVRYSEMLNDDGSKERGNDGPGGTLYLENIRTAKATLFYRMKGAQDGEQYTPSTSYWGFRFCEITADDEIEIKHIEAQPISSIIEETGDIITDNSLLNQLFSNILWSQRGNMLSIPTDCPQRDERQGWTGDAQAFCRTASYNANVLPLFTKYLQDLRDSQHEDGSYPDVAPYVLRVHFGNTGWADAGIIIPWKLYLMYGCKDVISNHYASMEKYMGWLATQTDGVYRYQGAKEGYGDWLAYDKCDSRYCSVSYYANDARLMAKMSRELSVSPDDDYYKKAEYYERLFQSIKDEFNERYWDAEPLENKQTTFLLPLAFDMLDEEKTNRAVILLKNAIDSNNGLLSTGFLGTSVFLPTLSKMGLNDEAYSILFQRSNPSWLYSIDQGATTIWERWDSYTKEKGFGPSYMNSFNHYSYGAVGEWLYRYMAGIEVSESECGFKSFVLAPVYDINSHNRNMYVSNVEAKYKSNYGTIKSSWEHAKNGNFDYWCEIPVNTTATLCLPNITDIDDIYEGSKHVFDSDGVEYLGHNSRGTIFKLGSGKYHFHYKNTTSDLMTNFDHNVIYYSDSNIRIEGQDIQTVELYGINGAKLSSLIANKQIVNLGQINPGFYLLRVGTLSGSDTYKIIIKK